VEAPGHVSCLTLAREKRMVAPATAGRRSFAEQADWTCSASDLDVAKCPEAHHPTRILGLVIVLAALEEQERHLEGPVST
jgi:hypothetical protein